MTDIKDIQKIIVLDYGSQYNQLIARRIREFGVFSELRSHRITADEVRAINPIGIILSGGQILFMLIMLLELMRVFLNSAFLFLEFAMGCSC